MSEDVLFAVEARAGDRPVAAIGVRCGALLRVVPEAFEQAFEMVAAGSVAADAEVELTQVPAEATCAACGARFTTHDPGAACPACHGRDVAVRCGDDLVLEWLRYHEHPAEVP